MSAHTSILARTALGVLFPWPRGAGCAREDERRRSGRGERGGATVLVVLLALALLTAGGLVIDGGYALAARRASIAQAEQAARVAADKLSETDLRSGESVVANAQARAAATSYLRAVGASGSVTVAAGEVTVTVREDYQPAVLSMVGIGSLDVGATATAVSIDDGDL